MDGTLRALDVRIEWAVPEAADAATRARWLGVLDASERAQADRFRFAADRDAYIAAHGLARLMLEKAVPDVPARRWQFVVGPWGKPEPDPALGCRGLRFNISHTRGFVCCATTWDRDIGVDVESLGRRPVSPGLPERFFAPCEAAMVAAEDAATRQDVFLRIWTLKEAFVKATGEGIGMGLDSFAFALDPPALRFAPASAGPPGAWRFMQTRPLPGHLMALAVRGAPSVGDAR